MSQTQTLQTVEFTKNISAEEWKEKKVIFTSLPENEQVSILDKINFDVGKPNESRIESFLKLNVTK